MSPERWQCVEELYHSTLERGASERGQYLAGACYGDEELRREVESLLETEESPRPILDGEAMIVPAIPKMGAGTKLGPYRIEGLLGEGGMGIVYRATDSKLNREVAIKTLPSEFARDGERRARFLREAQALGALNHPHIASIYGIEDTPETQAIIMELVEGPTLADRIAAGPVSADVAIDIGRQVCAALEAAHERGIIHRDLKPANIKVSDNGYVKLLDFGLAAFTGVDAITDPTIPPTPVKGRTNSGVILGTAAYMSPEQARGRKVDRRADIFAFGCVLFEMLAGKPAFPGEDVQEILAAVVKTEPDWNALRTETPKHLRSLLERCLQKDSRQRIRDIGDVAFELENAGETTHQRAGSAKPVRPIVWMFVGAAVAVSVVGISSRWLHDSPQGSVVQSSILLTSNSEGADAGWGFALSPDGQHLAFIGRGDGGTTLRLRNMQSGEMRTVPASNSAGLPFFSPDSRYVAYFAGRKLWKADLSGGQPQVICDAPGGTGGAWNQHGVIVLSANRGDPLVRVSASGGPAFPVTEIKDTGGGGHRFPVFLPDGKHLLYFVRAGQNQSGGIYVLDLERKISTRFMESESMVAYANGYILFVRGSTLFAQQIDLSAIKLTGQPIPIVQGVAATSQLTGLGPFAVSQTGLLTFGASVETEESQLTWFDRFGNRLATLGNPMSIREISLSPDAKRLAVSQLPKGENTDIWTYDLTAGTSNRLMLDARGSMNPVWSHDGKMLSYTRIDPAKTYWKPSNGSGDEQEFLNGGRASHWSTDGRYFSFITQSRLYIAPAEKGGTPELLSEVYGGTDAVFAPVQGQGGGYFVAYESAGASRRVHVQAYPTGGKWEVSSGEGRKPQWRRDGMELYYRSGSGDLVAVPVRLKDGFALGPSKVLFSIGRASNYVAHPDGQRFLIAVPAEEKEQPPLTLLSNWTALLQLVTKR